MGKIVNKHEEYLYLDENYYDKPKDSFKFIHKIITKYKKNNFELLDLGCARGEFFYYLSKKLEDNSTLTGIDYSHKLINDAKRKNYSVKTKFFKSDAYRLNLKQKFDVITASGIICYFDDINIFLKNVLKHLKKNGILIIFDNFNKYDVDIILRYRNNKYSNKFETGWNTHSLLTIKKFLKKKNFKIIEKKKFKLSFKLKEKKDPCRSWHVKVNNKLMFTTGLNQYWDLEALVIK